MNLIDHFAMALGRPAHAACAARSRPAPVPLVAGRPRGRYGPAYALEFRVSPNVWIVRHLHR